MATPEDEALPSSGFRATPRTHAADDVFEQLASAILRGELAVGSALPPERVLAGEFGTSRIIARQAIHRLAELGLVSVRQGGATLVQSVDENGDLRLLELLYRTARPSGARLLDARQVLEKQLLQGLSLVEITARCAKEKDCVRIREMSEEFARGAVDEASYVAFEERFWRELAAAGGNRILRMEVAWWYRVLPERPRVERYAPSPLVARVAFYRELARRLAEGDAAVEFYLQAVTPLLAVLRGQPRKEPAHAPPRRKGAR
jgi:GntR family transcriptional repressor for pyruvate dehydrogenase complex